MSGFKPLAGIHFTSTQGTEARMIPELHVSNPSREFTSLRHTRVRPRKRRMVLVSNPSREFTSLRRNYCREDRKPALQVSNPSREFTSLRLGANQAERQLIIEFQTPRGNSLHFDELAYWRGHKSFKFQTPRGNSLHFDPMRWR